MKVIASIFVAGVAGIVFISSLAFAQEKPVEKPTAAAAQAPEVPKVPDAEQELYAQLQVKDAGLTTAMALLQKERDSVNADRVRLAQRLIAAQPAFDLAQSGLLSVVYVPKKPAAKAPEKDESKQ